MKQNKNLRRKLKMKAIKHKGKLLHFQASMKRLLDKSQNLDDRAFYEYTVERYQDLIDECDERIKEL